MNKKAGTPQQQRATEFDKTPATATSTCPHKGQEIAIVPVRYALDRSRYDAAPDKLKPLPTSGKWTRLPRLSSRSYTLRQLYDGYLYVFDETARTFHEYAVTGADGVLTRIVWTQAQLGQDIRAGASEGKPYLLYPKMSRLLLAFSPMQWSWRLCEHIRSHEDSRAKWMKLLDLAQYCTSMAEQGTLPLAQVAEAVADIDKGSAQADGRFDDTSVPTSSDNAPSTETDAQCIPLFSPVGADAYWLGSVPDKHSALLIALDDPIAVMSDLGLQLAADQAAYRVWQEEHEHKVQMARTVTNLCASNDDPAGLPASVQNDVVATQGYLKEFDDCLEQMHREEIQHEANSMDGVLIPITSDLGSKMKQDLQERYAISPSDEEYEAWTKRAKWRREVDIDGARTYIAEHQPTAGRLLERIQKSRCDLQTYAEYIGLDPRVLFVDTSNQRSLLYLQTLMSELLTIYSQDLDAHNWLLDQEKQATSLFGTMRYGFSGEIKSALDGEANKLLDGINDYTNLATRVGELNSVLNHPEFAHMPWVNKLSEFARLTFTAVTELASSAGKTIAEGILAAWLPLDSRISHGEGRDLPTLLRSLMIGQVMLGSPHRIVIDAKVAAELKNWWRERLVLQDRMTKHKRSWTYPNAKRERVNISKQIAQLENRIRAHELKIPLLLDFQEHQYALSLQNEIRDHAGSYQESIEKWKGKADNWIGRLGWNFAAGITWGVIMLNMINTGLLYEALTRDGELSKGDLIKVGYGLGYTFNLLAAVYLEAPWAVLRAAEPVIKHGTAVNVLDRSASYWKKSGNIPWANAVRAFRTTLIVLGGFGAAAAALELMDLKNDFMSTNSQRDKIVIGVKGLAVALMGAGGLAQLVLGGFSGARILGLLLGRIPALYFLAAGLIYIVATMVLNYYKQDSVGRWLRKCCWSRSEGELYPQDESGAMLESFEFTNLLLSPQIFVKATTVTEHNWVGVDGNVSVDVIDGAWVQIQFPQEVRGNAAAFKIISSERSLGLGLVERSPIRLATDFLDNGSFAAPASLASISPQRPVTGANALKFPKVPAFDSDIVWQAWVPLKRSTDYIELQISYPWLNLHPHTHKPYLYQMEITIKGQSTSDGYSLGNLEVTRSGSDDSGVIEIL